MRPRQWMRLEAVSRHLHNLVGLRAALAPFRATLRALGEQVRTPEGRRLLLALWRPCQEQLDLLLDDVRPSADWAVRMSLLRWEMEDNLLDELYSPTALQELAENFEQACEALLLRLERELSEAVAEAKRYDKQGIGRPR